MTVDREPTTKRVVQPAPAQPSPWDLLRLKGWQQFQDSQNQPHREPTHGNVWGPQPPETSKTKEE